MKNRIYIYIIAIITALLPCSCIEGDEFEDTNEGIFDALWTLIDQRYCFLGYAEEQFGLDWDKMYHKYRSQITEKTTKRELFDICGNMLGELRDGHVDLTSTYGTTYNWDWKLKYPINFSDSLQRNYLGTRFMLNNGVRYTILGDSIAYAYLNTFENSLGDGNLTALLYDISPCKALILDIRNNGGGMLTAAERLASMFTDERIHCGYIQHKTGKGHYDFSKPEKLYLEPSEGVIWMRPVVVLTNRGVYSSANYFVMLMRELQHVTILGDRTGGGSGMPLNSTLPNGWTVRFSACPILDAQGRHTEFGIEPDVRTDITTQDWNSGRDTMIEKAKELIFDFYSKKAQEQGL